MKLVASALLIACLALVATPLMANECEEAMTEYNAALVNISASISSYQGCLDASQGQSDCASEFKALDGNQEIFEKAVRNLKGACK